MSNEKPGALELADIFENLAHPTGPRHRAATELLRLHAKVQVLEAMLESIGAGGVSAQRIRQESDYITQPIEMVAASVVLPEPAAWKYSSPFGKDCYYSERIGFPNEYPYTNPEPLYTEQQVRELLAAQTQKRKPLTDVELQAAIRQTSMQQQANCGYPSFKNLMNLARAIARAIERAHGIGDTNEN